MDRKHPLEKERLTDFSSTNKLSPEWMQVTHKKKGTDPLKQIPTYLGVRQEHNRSILVEKVQPKRSIFNSGSIRHNVHSVELTNKFMDAAFASGNVVDHPVRMIEWNENPGS